MEELYGQYKSLLFILAYQLTGSAADAEDAVQDVFMKAYDVQVECLEEPKAYLCKMVTNRCLDLQKSARRRREMYVGPWLPEPFRTPEVDTLRDDGCPPGYAILRHARYARETDADRASGFRPA